MREGAQLGHRRELIGADLILRPPPVERHQLLGRELPVPVFVRHGLTEQVADEGGRLLDRREDAPQQGRAVAAAGERGERRLQLRLAPSTREARELARQAARLPPRERVVEADEVAYLAHAH